MIRPKKLICLFLFVLKFFPVSAQETELDPVTVTASLVQKKISETGRNLFIIKGEQFDKLPVNSIDELLRYIPGVEVQQRGIMGSQSDILMRGGTFQQVLILLDGIRLNDPLTGHFNSYIPITPGEIERIEILKGASSAIYGADAVGGVIQVITKTFAAKQDANSKELSGQLSVGQYGMFSINAAGRVEKKNTAVSVGLLSDNARGMAQRGTTGFFHNTTAGISIKQVLNKAWSIALQSSYDRRNFSAQNYYTAFVSDTATENVSSFWNHLNISFNKTKHHLSFNTGFKHTDDEYRFSKGVSPNINKSILLQSQLIYNYSFSTKTGLTSGLQFTGQTIASNDRGDHKVMNGAAFIVLHQRLWSGLHISPALRLDKNELAGWEFIPQINASYHFKNLTLRAMAGKTTRIADFTERFNNYNKPLVSSGNIGNPDLKAEYSFSWEAGADYLLSNSLKVSATYFNKKYSRLIDWINTPYQDMPRQANLVPDGKYFLAKNISDIRTSGFETDLVVNKENFYGTIGLLWLHSTPAASLYISSHARFLLNYSFSYDYKIFRLSVNGIYKQRNEQKGNLALLSLDKDYFLVNGKLMAFVYKRKLSAFTQVNNIFDRQYADRFGVPMPGRWWMAGLQFQFK